MLILNQYKYVMFILKMILRKCSFLITMYVTTFIIDIQVFYVLCIVSLSVY